MNSSMICLIYCKNFCNCYNVSPAQIKKKRKGRKEGRKEERKEGNYFKYVWAGRLLCAKKQGQTTRDHCPIHSCSNHLCWK
jgi:hypothetical protein